MVASPRKFSLEVPSLKNRAECPKQRGRRSELESSSYADRGPSQEAGPASVARGLLEVDDSLAPGRCGEKSRFRPGSACELHGEWQAVAREARGKGDGRHACRAPRRAKVRFTGRLETLRGGTSRRRRDEGIVTRGDHPHLRAEPPSKRLRGEKVDGADAEPGLDRLSDVLRVVGRILRIELAMKGRRLRAHGHLAGGVNPLERGRE